MKIFNVNIYILISFAISIAIFTIFPQIDLYISSLFYDELSQTFTLKHTVIERVLYNSVKYLLIGAVFFLIAGYFYKKIDKKSIIFILLSLIIAPGLIVNATLKDHWGRPRPAQIKEFGGNYDFQKAFVIGSNKKGHSFSSGHAAAAFSFLAFVLIVKRYKKFWFYLALLYGTLVSLARVVAGGHFLSDVVTSFFIVYIVTHILYRIIFKEDSSL